MSKDKPSTDASGEAEAEAHARTRLEYYEDLPAELEEIIAATMAQIPLTEEGEIGGPLNRRLAFELAEMIGPDGASDLMRFATLVRNYAGAQA